ncbi:MAG: glycosyltransferase [Lachnospiraceae bacterium]|nr:glycosyltransferase [Lachnospiraceae bacterium]
MKEFIKSALRYEQKININPNLVYGKILTRIQDNSDVLEFGSGAGVMTKSMAREKNCRVNVVEIDADCFKAAMEFASDGFCGDIEQYEWKKKLAKKRFDYVLFVDVLEHMREPWKVLKEASKYLKEDGAILISVPNVSHNSVIIQLLNNRFIYGDTGILDYTHLHHFTFTEIQELVSECGLKSVYLDATYIAVGKNEFDVTYGSVDPYIEEILRKRPFGEVYQYILEVRKSKYVEKNNIGVDNRLGSPASFVEFNGKRIEGADTILKDETEAILSRYPNFFFGTNEEIAKLRLELNDLYNLSDEEEAYKGAMDRIASLQHDLDRKNSLLSKINEETATKDARIVDLQNEQEERNAHIKVLDKEIEGYIEEIKDLRKESEVLNDRNESISQELKNKEGHIELLLETERKHLALLDCNRLEIDRLNESERNARNHLEQERIEKETLKENDRNRLLILEEKTAQINRLSEAENEYRTIINQNREEIAGLKQIESTQKTLIEQNELKIDGLNSLLEQNKTELENCRSLNAQKDEEIEKLKESDETNRNLAEQRNSEIARLKENEENNRRLLEQSNSVIERLKERDEFNREIIGLKEGEIKRLAELENNNQKIIERNNEEINALKENAIQKNEELIVLKERAKQKDVELATLKESAKKSNEEAIVLREKIEENNKEIAELNDRVKQSDEQFAAFNERAKQSDEEIATLNERAKQSDEHVAVLNERVKQSDDEIVRLKGEVEKSQEELIALNETAAQRDEEINSLKENERNLRETIERANEDTQRLNEELENLRQKEKEYVGIIAADREKEAEYKQTILNKEGHIELLLEVEREYEREKKSRTYRVALIFRKISSFFFPEKSKRRFIAGILVKGLKNPKLFFKMVNARRIKNFFEMAKTEGMDSVREHYRLVEEVEKSRMNPFDSDKYVVTEVEGEGAENKKIEDYEKLAFAEIKKPEVSIVIPVYNQFEYTYQCLKSIKEQSGDALYEIIIADDCSTDITAQIKKIVTGIKVVRNKDNLRFLKNCNNAAKQAKGKFILFLNNDTQVQENWLNPLIRVMHDDEKAGMVGSKLIYPDGWLQEAGGIVWNDASAWNYGNRKNPDDPEFNYLRETDYVSGASIMIRTSLWKEIGGFDERFAPAYYEDTDLAFEVRKHGYKVIYQPLSAVVHFEGVSNGTDVNEGQKAYQVENCKKFYEKWKDVLEKEHFPNAENVFLAKDRSRFKKQMLVVDHYVPHYDQDAGGKCTYMYLLLMVKMGFKVTFIGDNFFKHEPYTTELNQKGIEVLYGNYYYNNWEEWLKDNLHYFDYVYLQRPHISIKYMDLVKQYGRAKVFYFAHDLHHVREMREYELTHDPEKLESANKWKEIEYDLFRKADVGHVVGSYEQGVMQKVFPDKPIRNIPLYIYDDIPDDIDKDFDKRKDMLFVGGFGHPPNADAVLWFAENVFPKILKKIPDIKWHVVGGKVPDKVQELNDEHILIEGFLSDEELHKLYRTCKLAVVPLRYGAGVKGKVVEAAYFQIPMVTTPIGAEGIDSEMGSMIVTDDPDLMAEKICSLYNDGAKLREMSDCGRKLIEKYYTLDEAERVLRQDL